MLWTATRLALLLGFAATGLAAPSTAHSKSLEPNHPADDLSSQEADGTDKLAKELAQAVTADAADEALAGENSDSAETVLMEPGKKWWKHRHRPHGHLPHGHRPHGHLPHGHRPHRHRPHWHFPHGHNPHTHIPFAKAAQEAVDGLTAAGGNLAKATASVASAAYANTGMDDFFNEVGGHLAEYAEMVASFFGTLGCEIKPNDYVNAVKQLTVDFAAVAGMATEASSVGRAGATAHAACSTVWAQFGSVNALLVAYNLLVDKCDALSGGNPALSIGVTLTAGAQAGIDQVSVGAELGVAFDADGERMCYVGGCVGRGGAMPPDVSSGAGVGVAITFWGNAQAIPGAINFLALDANMDISIFGVTVSLSGGVAFFYPDSGIQDMKGVGIGLEVSPQADPTPGVGGSVTVGICWCPVCIQLGESYNSATSCGNDALSLAAVTNTSLVATEPAGPTAIAIGKDPTFNASLVHPRARAKLAVWKARVARGEIKPDSFRD